MFVKSDFGGSAILGIEPGLIVFSGQPIIFSGGAITTYIEYRLDDDTTILIETDEPHPGGVTKAGRDEAGRVIAAAGQKFGEAFAAVKKSALILRRQLMEMRADETTVTFGLKAGGQAGSFIIGKANMEANYTVTLTWKQAAETGEKKQKEAGPEQKS